MMWKYFSCHEAEPLVQFEGKIDRLMLGNDQEHKFNHINYLKYTVLKNESIDTTKS